MNTKLSALALAAALIPLAHAEPPTPEFTSGGISSRTSPQQPVGTTVKAEADARAQDAATDIASITADRGIVTRPGRFTIEPSFSHAHSNATRVAIEGYTVIPALLIGLINIDRKSTRLNSSHVRISYAVFCLKKKKQIRT